MFISMFDNDVIVRAIPALQGPDYCVGLVLTQQVQALLSEGHTVCQQPTAAVLLRVTTYPLSLSVSFSHTHCTHNASQLSKRQLTKILKIALNWKL